MLKRYLGLLLLFSSLNVLAEEVRSAGIIPAPAHIEFGSGAGAVLSEEITYYSDFNRDALSSVEDWMSRMGGKVSPFTYKKESKERKAELRLYFTDTVRPEGYYLDVEGDIITVRASDKAGLLYALQSLCQMSLHYSMKIPEVHIQDYPRFSHRGIMLDPARNFFPLDFIKKQLDMMAYYKLNTFHWHLTEDAGWRIEIKQYPELTEKAAYYPFRNHEEWWLGDKSYCTKDAPGATGGYYTQEEVKEIVSYAEKLSINIIPEIDIPAHAAALIYAYPELRCPSSNANILCPGNEYVYEFMENVYEEIMAIFPSKMIHVGCDEVYKGIWKECPLCQKKMSDEKLSSVDELQSYMMKRFDRFFTEHGRRMVGWNEIMHGGLAENAVVMSWTGVDGGIEAARQGKDAIMCPERYCYLDGIQDDPTIGEISSSWYLPLDHVYSYDPAPSDLGEEVKKHIIGVQGNLWSEWQYPETKVEKYLWPRAMAIAEIGWTPDEKKSFTDFRANAVESVDRLKALGYNPFDLRNERGERPGYGETDNSLSTGKKILGHESDARYRLLTDGQKGSWRLDGTSWFMSSGYAELVVDLEVVQPIEYIWVSFIQARGFRIPCDVRIEVSEDNAQYRCLYDSDNDFVYEPINYFYNRYIENSWKGRTSARYVKIIVNGDCNWGLDEIEIR